MTPTQAGLNPGADLGAALGSVQGEQKRQARGPSLKGRALRYLAAREYGRLELERKLKPHAESAEQIAAVLNDLQAKGFISDARAAVSLVHRRAEKLGNARVLQELKQKGLAPEAIASASENLAQTEGQRAHSVWQKRFGALATDAAERAKQMRFLASRGFSAASIRLALRQAGGDLDEDFE